MAQLLHTSALKMDQFLHPGQSGVGSGNGHHLIINVIALNIGFRRQVDQRLRFVHSPIPVLSVHNMSPVLRRKTAVHARCHMGRHHGRLYGNRPAAAERIHQDAVSPPGRQHDQRRRQILRYGRFGRQFPVAALVQGIARRIQSHRHLIFHQKDPDRVGIPALLKPVHMIRLLHPLHHRFFHNGLDVGGAKELTLHAGRLRHPEFTVLRYVIAPGQSLRPLKKLFESLRVKAACLDQHTLRRPEKNIGTAKRQRVPGKSDTHVFHRRDLISKIRNLPF